MPAITAGTRYMVAFWIGIRQLFAGRVDHHGTHLGRLQRAGEYLNRCPDFAQVSKIGGG